MRKICSSLLLLCTLIIQSNRPPEKSPFAQKFTVVLLPDTQHYTMYNGDETYNKQTEWIVENKTSENIKFVIHLGDITQHNSSAQWKVAREAHSKLEKSKVPYSVVPGNHDYYPWPNNAAGQRSLVRDTRNYNQHFGPQWFNVVENDSWYGGHMGSGNENNYYFFESGNLKFMVVGLEYAPRKDALCWAEQKIREHPNRRVIIVTHCYQTNNGGHNNNCAAGYNTVGSAGETIWEELAKRHNNVFMVLSGHVNDSEYRERTGNAGNKVHEILTDYQSEQKNINGTLRDHGNGWMRTLTFDPDNNSIQVRTFTPISGVSSFTQSGNYNTSPSHNDHRYSITYDMGSMPAYAYNKGTDRFNDLTVNSAGTGQQKKPVVAAARNGDFVVVWEDDSQGSEGVYQIFARGFNAGGCEKFHDITVNVDSRGQQLNPAVAMANDGSFVVVWEDDPDGNGFFQLRGALFNAAGRKKSLDFTVNTHSTRQQRKPAIAMAQNGDFVVAWEDDSQDPAGVYQIFARGFYANGTQKFADKVINEDAAGQQLKPAIAMSDDGDFVVVWEDDKDNNQQFQIKGAAFNANGSRKRPDFTVNTNANRQQLKPSIGMASNGDFVVAWEDDSGGSSGVFEIFARGFNDNGSQKFADKTVNTNGTGQQYKPCIAMRNNGDFTVVWEDDSHGVAGIYQIYARGFNANGTQKFADITVNKNSYGQQSKPKVAVGTNGIFVVVWEDDLDGNNVFQVLARGIDGNGN